MNKFTKKLLKFIYDKQKSKRKSFNPKITISSGLTSSVNPGEVIKFRKQTREINKGGIDML